MKNTQFLFNLLSYLIFAVRLSKSQTCCSNNVLKQDLNVSVSPPQMPNLSLLSFPLFPRIQRVKELGDLSPHWDGLRYDVINHCNYLIGCYQETLTNLEKLSGEVSQRLALPGASLYTKYPHICEQL